MSIAVDANKTAGRAPTGDGLQQAVAASAGDVARATGSMPALVAGARGSMPAPTRAAHWITCGALFLGCAAPLAPGQRARDAAYEYAMAVRFGRMDLAAERVSQTDRDVFLSQHAAWGNGVRILDCELVGISLRSPGEAEVLLNVGWERADEADVRTTQIGQRWRDHRGSWLLEREQRLSGDVGLLGEATTVVAAPTSSARFESKTIR